MIIKTWLAIALACGISSVAAFGQQSATPQPADNGPSLAATMQILQSMLNGQGQLNWVTHYHDSADGRNWDHALSFEATKAIADASECTITYHYKIVRDGAQLSDADARISLHDVQDMMLTTGDQRQNRNDAATGHPTWTAKVDPPLFDLVVKSKGPAENYFFFYDEDTANRATKALGHAVELCGGSRGSF